MIIVCQSVFPSASFVACLCRSHAASARYPVGGLTTPTLRGRVRDKAFHVGKQCHNRSNRSHSEVLIAPAYLRCSGSLGPHLMRDVQSRGIGTRNGRIVAPSMHERACLHVGPCQRHGHGNGNQGRSPGHHALDRAQVSPNDGWLPPCPRTPSLSRPRVPCTFCYGCRDQAGKLVLSMETGAQVQLSK